MNKGSVPTAIAALAVIAICFVGYMYIKDNVEQKRLQKSEAEASEIGKLPQIKVFISGKAYNASLESNKTAKSFLENLPLTINMTDGDSYSKKGYTYVKLTETAYKPKSVKAGDIMLKGESEVMLFFKDCNTSEKYSKIGHVDNLYYIDGSSVTVGFNKID